MLRLPESQYLKMVGHALDGLPLEACGLFGGDARIGKVEIPVGLILIFLVLLVAAVVNLLTKETATIWGLATHEADANRIVAWTLFGEVYVTEDAGESWRKIAREFGEIRTAAWLPA